MVAVLAYLLFYSSRQRKYLINLDNSVLFSESQHYFSKKYLFVDEKSRKQATFEL